MQSLSKQWNQQLSWYVFSKVIKCLEQNVRKQIDCKETIADQTNELNTKYVDMRKYKAVECFEI